MSQRVESRTAKNSALLAEHVEERLRNCERAPEGAEMESRPEDASVGADFVHVRECRSRSVIQTSRRVFVAVRVDLEGRAPAHRLPRSHIFERPAAREPPKRAR